MRHNIWTFYILFTFTLIFPSGKTLPANFQENENIIHGCVYDKSTGEPIENANVYFSYTTWGSSTNRDGYYTIKNIPDGIHELVISVIGYEISTSEVELNSDSYLILNFSLEPIIYKLPPTQIFGEVPEQWMENLEVFKEYFLGRGKFADDCTIENEIYLDFVNISDSLFEAKSDRPLIIINNALGYRIECALMKFIHRKDRNLLYYRINPKFVELKPEDADEYDDWIENRWEAFSGSLRHFYRSFFKRRVEENGFKISAYNAGRRTNGLRLPLSSPQDYDRFLQPSVTPDLVNISFPSWIRVVYNRREISWISVNYNWITLDRFGYTQEIGATSVDGEWGKDGVADILPKDYMINN
jgi:hypothetical protein